jgi:3-phosphoglycerate kinase
MEGLSLASLPIFDTYDLHGKTVLVRVDLNVPMQNGLVQDTTRFEAIKPTLDQLIKMQARVVLLAHFGRPKGHPQEALSLKHIVADLKQVLQQEVYFIDKLPSSVTKADLTSLQPGQIALLENLRFEAGEEANDLNLAKTIASLGDFYVNDAFAVSHRAHMSVAALTEVLPSAAGYLLRDEMTHLTKALSTANQPSVAIIGGAKISTKIGLLKALVTKVDTLVLGGGIANTFLLALQHPIGTSLAEQDQVEVALSVIQAAKEQGCNLILPLDARVTKDFGSHASIREIELDDIHEFEGIYDLGHKTIEAISDTLLHAHTVIWNGPVGYYERPPFDKGTTMLAHTIGALTSKGRLKSFAGGGETVGAIKQAKQEHNFTYLSTGGGAFLEFIEGKRLPGIEALLKGA